MTETKSVNFRLPLNLVESLKTQAQAQNTTQQALLSLFIQEGLKELLDSSISLDSLSVPHSRLDQLATDNQVLFDRIETLEDYFSDYLSKDSQSLYKRIEILEKVSAHLARQQAAIKTCVDKHLALSEELQKANSCISALQTKISNLDGELSLLQEQVEQLLSAVVLATPNPPTELVDSASETISPENTTSKADDDTARKEQGWIDLSSAYEYAQRQGYKGKKEAFRMLSKSRCPDAAYAQWGLQMDLRRRGCRGQKSKWLLPTAPEHYRQLMGNASAAAPIPSITPAFPVATTDLPNRD